ncbi:hypothetical protein EN849_33065, partial [Mesorhizobium sp. M2D.F.Ca.ET.206.01.1.1]
RPSIPFECSEASPYYARRWGFEAGSRIYDRQCSSAEEGAPRRAPRRCANSSVIAEIEAKEPLEALDTFMAQNASMIQAQHAASSFDVHRVLQAMDHEPRPPQG